jgi:hydroxyacylglutathione hydrolase
MILEQYYLGCLAHASYLIADPESGQAAVVDPQRDVDHYVADAHRHGCRVSYVILTHFHADFVAGHLELRDREGAEIVLGARAEAEYEFRPMGDGSTIDMGTVRLAFLETPGHSPESISVLVYDLAKNPDRPHAVLTGDTLFVGDVGRPDLRASLGWSAEDLGALLYDSLRNKLLPLPDETLVYPTHGAGSLCGKNISSETVSTIGEQRRSNYALQPMARADFIRIVTADQPDSPAYFTYDAVLNTKERITLESSLGQRLTPLTLREILQVRDARGQVLDCRDASEFERAHVAGSVNIGLDGSFATWCGTLLQPDRPIALVADPGRETEAATRLGRIGFDNVAGFLDGGMQSLDKADLEAVAQGIGRVSPTDLASRLESDRPPLVLDVRDVSEWEAKHIDGSVNIPLGRLPEGIPDLPREREIVVHCAGGYRSAVAASLLRGAGFDHVEDLAGGMAAWEASRMAATT